MANVTIQINSPILSGSEKFKVRYRSLPVGVYSAYQDETNAAFVLVLSEGSYEIEIIFVNANGEECDAVYEYYTVYPDYECITFTTEMVLNASTGIYYVEISYTLPPTSPPCGWEVFYKQGSVGFTVIPYATLPASPIRIPVPNADTDIVIHALLCNGRYNVCYDDTVEAIEAPCTPLVITDTYIAPNTTPNAYSTNVFYTNSIPRTNPFFVTYQQIGVPLVAGQPLDNGTFTSTGFTSGAFGITVIPTPVFGAIVYKFSFTDNCGVNHEATLTYD